MALFMNPLIPAGGPSCNSRLSIFLDQTLHFTHWSLGLFICVRFRLHGEHTILQPFRRIKLIVQIAISVLPGTHYHLSQVEHLRCALPKDKPSKQ